MEEQEFNFNPILYPIALVGYVTGTILDDRISSSSWVPWIVYGVATLLMIIAFLKHRSITINDESIRVKEILRNEKVILKSDVNYYRTTYEYRKTPYTTWYFTMKNGTEILLTHDFMRNEPELTLAVNKWCSTLPMEESV